MFSNAPVAFLCTLMSLLFASRVNGANAPEVAICALFSSCVARFVMQPTALHWTSTLLEFICLIRGSRPPSSTIRILLEASTARLPSAADDARCTSMSGLSRRYNIGLKPARLTGLTSKLCSVSVNATHDVSYLFPLSLQMSNSHFFVGRGSSCIRGC